jgi:ABC-2 type transport system permease protein
MLTITSLTIRQFLRSRSIYVVIGISLLAAVFAIVPRLAVADENIRDLREAFADTLYLGMITGTLLPLAVLVLATSAIGDEIDDRTFQYLALKPLSRFRIVLEKLLAVFIVLTPITWAGIALTWGIISFGNIDAMSDLLWPALVSSLIAIVGFGSIFMLVSMVVNRALLIGVFYVFVWETSLSRILPGLRSISIRHFTQSQFARLVDDRRITVTGASSESTVIIATIAILVISVALATWRLRTMSLD